MLDRLARLLTELLVELIQADEIKRVHSSFDGPVRQVALVREICYQSGDLLGFQTDCVQLERSEATHFRSAANQLCETGQMLREKCTEGLEEALGHRERSADRWHSAGWWSAGILELRWRRLGTTPTINGARVHRKTVSLWLLTLEAS